MNYELIELKSRGVCWRANDGNQELVEDIYIKFRFIQIGFWDV